MKWSTVHMGPLSSAVFAFCLAYYVAIPSLAAMLSRIRGPALSNWGLPGIELEATIKVENIHEQEGLGGRTVLIFRSVLKSL